MTNADNNARVRVRVDDREVEVEGTQEFVSQQIRLILKEMRINPSSSDGIGAGQLVVINQNDVPITLDEIYEEDPMESLVEAAKSMPNSQKTESLIDFFQRKAPKSQSEVVLTITYHLTKIEGRQSLSLDDYAAAFSQLRRLAVKTPANLKSTVRNVVDRTQNLYNPDRGVFALTLQGEKLVESMPLAE